MAFCSGFYKAFWVFYWIIDLKKKETSSARRKSPRVSIEEIIEVTISGVKYKASVENLSERGARLTLNSDTPAAIGDIIVLQFKVGEIKGQIVSVRNGRLRIEFDRDSFSHSLLESYFEHEADRPLSGVAD